MAQIMEHIGFVYVNYWKLYEKHHTIIITFFETDIIV